jgi:hypothetical protein
LDDALFVVSSELALLDNLIDFVKIDELPLRLSEFADVDISLDLQLESSILP